MIIGFAFLVANVSFGYLLDSSGLAVAATYSVITSFVAIEAMIVFISREKRI